jgi:hypothetical protein
MTQTNENSHTYEIGDAESTNEAVLQAIDAVSEESLLEQPPLHESIDMDALANLFESSDSISSVGFAYEGYKIVVTPHHVRIREQ